MDLTDCHTQKTDVKFWNEDTTMRIFSKLIAAVAALMAATGILSSRAFAAPDAPATAAVATPAGSAEAKVANSWQRALVAHIAKYKSYRRTDIERTVIVEFTVDRKGHVAAVKIRKTSGDAAIDEAGLAMVRRADPVPPPPAAVTDDKLAFQLPVVFRPPPKQR